MTSRVLVFGERGQLGQQLLGADVRGMMIRGADGTDITDADAVAAIDYATMMGADVTSNSWGGGGFSQTMLDAVAMYENGVVMTSPDNPRDLMASWSAMVPLLTYKRFSKLSWRFKCSSNSFTNGPLFVNQFCS